jgi:hypothetical protein
MITPKTPLNTITHKSPRSVATILSVPKLPKLQATPAPKLQKPRRRKINKQMEIKVLYRKSFFH